MLMRMWSSWNSHTVNGNTKWYSHLEKTFWLFLMKLNIYLLNDPTIFILGIYSRKMKTCPPISEYL